MFMNGPALLTAVLADQQVQDATSRNLKESATLRQAAPKLTVLPDGARTGLSGSASTPLAGFFLRPMAFRAERGHFTL